MRTETNQPAMRSFEDVVVKEMRKSFAVNFLKWFSLDKYFLIHTIYTRHTSVLIFDVSSILCRQKSSKHSRPARKQAVEGWHDCLRTEPACSFMDVSILEACFY